MKIFLGEGKLKEIRKLMRIIFTYEDNGYRKVRIIDQSVHRLVASIKLGRSLKKGEVVHHKNHNKQDNRPKNLQIFKSQSEHMKHHWKQRKRKI